MPPIRLKRVIPNKPKQTPWTPEPFVYGVDKFRCPECGALHHYPFRDGCHNDACAYSGELEKQ